MRRLLSISLVACLSIDVAARQQVLRPPDTQARPTRTIVARLGRPLTQGLRPSDQVLEVEDLTMPGATSGLPENTSRVEAMTAASEFVGTVQVVSMTGRFTTDGDRIETDVTARIIDAEKDTRSNRKSSGEALQFTLAGGEVRIGHQVIRMSRPGDRQPQPGNTFFVFAASSSRDVLTVRHSSMYLVSGDTLTPLRDDPRYRDFARSVSDLKQRVRAAMAK